MSRPSTLTQFLVRTTNLFPALFFTRFSGINDKTNSEKYISPIYHREYLIPGARQHSPVSLGTPFYPDIHKEVVNSWNRYSNSPLNIEIEPTFCGPNGHNRSYGYKYRLEGCIWTGMNLLKVDRSSNDISELMLEFSYVNLELI